MRIWVSNPPAERYVADPINADCREVWTCSAMIRWKQRYAGSGVETVLQQLWSEEFSGKKEWREVLFSGANEL